MSARNAILLQRSRQQDQMTKLVRSIKEQNSHINSPPLNLPILPSVEVIPDSLSRDGRTSEVVIVKKFI